MARHPKGMTMMSNERLVRVQWGDCDPAGIVYYPRYFAWADDSTLLLFEKATGIKKIEMLRRHGGAGIALLEAHAVFKVASAYGDDLTVASRVTEFRRSVFKVEHRFTKGEGVLALEVHETRLWTVRDPLTGRIKSGDMPAEIIAAFGAP